MGAMSQEDINADLFDEVQRLKKENQELKDWKKKAENTIELIKVIADSLEQQNDVKDQKIEELEGTIEKVKDVIANDVFAVLSHNQSK